MTTPEIDILYKDMPYTWAQTLTDVTITIPVPEGTRGKAIDCKISRDSMHLKLKASDDYILKGQFHKAVKKDDCVWQIEDQKEVIISLTKVNQAEWWACVIEGHPKVDTTKIQPENSKLSDLDGETRGMVEKMMFDQRQKAAGKPSSDEITKQDALKNFMASHPEMDFSEAKIM
eukprot:TRINITY_DN1768_c0_g1_i1.p2 TRINITY_DN1768_c0_g1~~TRINITY_DN1768_c0_g1_i1.p2  ORF type:complete len:181 (+),score=41.30 TRINITY_DN1768_c0_g1_i1:24-545(+)